ncbi:hypothetical protein EDD86DRAFT_214672 [Gorgonomyces haynaldii]|nr:hypothetical protein EDD86DRAFT_214672 [Gorgonomyces haynaldii]
MEQSNVYEPVVWDNGSESAPPMTSFDPLKRSDIEITVSDPQKHGDGGTGFVTYLVTSKYQNGLYNVRRRFQDFVQLFQMLLETQPSCIIPPMPDKHRMEYFTGDRFSIEFLEKRRQSLQSFLHRIARHPVLQHCDALTQFLQIEQISSAQLFSKRESKVLENLSEALINAFVKVKRPDERFIEVKESVTKFEQNLLNIEKLHTKLLKIENDLFTDFSDLGGSLVSFGMMETQITEPLNAFGTRLPNYAQYFKDKSETEDMDYISNLREYTQYCLSVKDLLKLRDQKQMDHEELQSWLQNHHSDRERTLSTGKSPGFAGFIKDKINDFKGVDPEKARQDRLGKLENKIEELQAAVEQSQTTSKAFSDQTLLEVQYFNEFKHQDFKSSLRDFADTQLEFHQQGLKFWDNVGPILDMIRLE